MKTYLEKVFLKQKEVQRKKGFSFGFQHTWDLNKDSIIPNWKTPDNTDAVGVALGELNWLFSTDPEIQTLHANGAHHRDDLAVKEDLTVDKEVDLEYRLDQLCDRLAEQGVVIESMDEVFELFNSNRMMEKHLTLEACLEASGFPEVQNFKVVEAGGTGKNHGDCFANPGKTGIINFQNDEMLPLPDLTPEGNLLEARWTYVPKQITLSFSKFEIPVRKRLETFLESGLEDTPLVMTLKCLVEGLSYDEAAKRNQHIAEEWWEIDRDSATKMVLNELGITEYELHAHLHLSSITPLTEYAYEVLPYFLYSLGVARKVNAVLTQCHLYVNNLVFDDLDAELLENLELEEEGQLKINLADHIEGFASNVKLTRDDLIIV